jgi:hypothetical protein
MTGYPDLYSNFGWKPGVYRSPVGYAHPWVCVTEHGTTGHWTREEARLELRRSLNGFSESAILDRLNREAEKEFLAEVSREFSRKKGG